MRASGWPLGQASVAVIWGLRVAIVLAGGIGRLSVCVFPSECACEGMSVCMSVCMSAFTVMAVIALCVSRALFAFNIIHGAAHSAQESAQLLRGLEGCA